MKPNRTGVQFMRVGSSVLCAFVTVLLSVTAVARAAEAKPDLSTPEKAVTAFVKALDEGDATRIAGITWTWRLGVDNLFDKRAWRESPFEFSHVYLFPLAPRTWRVSVQADL